MKKPVVIAAVAAVVLLAVGYFLVLPMMKPKVAAPAVAGASAAAADDGTPSPSAAAKKRKRKNLEPGLIYPLNERVLNLSSSAGTPHYARIEVALEFARPAGSKPAANAAAKPGPTPPPDPALDPVYLRSAQIDDALVRIVSTKTMEVLTTADGKDAFKQELLDTIADIVPSPDIQNVYIVRLVVQ